MLDLYPSSDLFCLLDTSDGKFKDRYKGKSFSRTFLQPLAAFGRLKPLRGLHRYFLPLMPIAVEQIDLAGYDIIISNSHAVAKGVIAGPDQLHICYCYTPMRYAWDLQNQYLREQRITGLRGLIARWILHKVRMWDIRSANGVDHFIACSAYIQRRITRTYRRDSNVIYPGTDVEYYCPSHAARQDFYITASRLVPYKRVTLIAEAFAAMPDRKLVIIGDGPQFKSVKKAAAHASNIVVLGYQPDHVLLRYLQTAKAYVFAAEEDFGISPVEAQSCGTPVLAYGKGGACETVIDGVTGLLFDEQSAGAIEACVRRFETMQGQFDETLIRRHAEGFSIERFRREFKTTVDGLIARHQRRSTGELLKEVAAE